MCPNFVANDYLRVDNFWMNQRSSDFKTYLQEELVYRCKKNPAYSLRGFAKSVGVSPSFLSKVLNGQRRITESVFRKITTNLNLKETNFDYFDYDKNVSSSAELKLQDLQLVYFKIISDWYHYAIIELTNVEGFQSSPEWIATKLGITVNQVKSAVERLLQLDLLHFTGGQLKASSGGNTTTKNDFTDLAFKKMQDELLKKAITSLWNEEMSRRDHTSISMAIHPEDIPEVKKRLTKMRREICKYLERPQNKKPTQVYNLSLSFFALSKESP